VFTVSHVDQLAPNYEPQLRLAVSVAFSASESSRDPSEAPPLLLLRLTHDPRTAQYGVVGYHLAGADPVVEVGQLTPEACRAERSVAHLGSLVATNLWAPASAGRSNEHGRIIVGVTMSGWSLAIRERWDGGTVTCQIAEPSEFGKLGDELADALAALNNKFPLFAE
jgi:hypothetical protein